jgi:hypothetical protein
MDDLRNIHINNWNNIFRPGGLLVLIETNSLCRCHQPQSAPTIQDWTDMENALRFEYGHDTSAGCNTLDDIIVSTEMIEIVYENNHSDNLEFAFDGSVSPMIQLAWSH